MTNQCKRTVFAFFVVNFFLQLSAMAQQPKPPQDAPLPARIAAAKKVFIANGGQDEHSTDGPAYNGGPDRAYNQLYSALKAWGHYDLVSDPADADLALEIEFLVNRPAIKGQSLTSSDFDPKFRLSIRDPKTNVVLWRVIQHADWALLQGNRDRNFDQALTRIVNDVEALALRSSTDANNVKP